MKTEHVAGYTFNVTDKSYTLHNHTWPLTSSTKKCMLKFDDLIKSNQIKHICDIGAQSGCFSILAKHHRHTNWVAFEPVKLSFQILNDNLVANKIDNVNTINSAVSDRVGVSDIKIPTDRHHYGYPTLGTNPPHIKKYRKEQVKTTTIDTFYKDKQIDLIKIDAEGAELDILKGGKLVLERDKPIIMLELAKGCLQGFGYTIKDLLDFIKKCNYKITWYDHPDYAKGGNIVIEHR